MLKALYDVLMPEPDATESQVAQWRYLVGLSMTGLWAAVICLYVITARAADLNRVHAAVLVPALQSLRERVCLSHEVETRRLLEQKMIELEKDYRDATGADFPRESCEDIRARQRGE